MLRNRECSGMGNSSSNFSVWCNSGSSGNAALFPKLTAEGHPCVG